MIAAKPEASTRTSYAPARSEGAEYRPFSPVWMTRDAPVSLFVTVTVAFWITAPDGSVTVPTIVPVGTCAISGIATTSKMTHAKACLVILTIFLLSVGREEPFPLNADMRVQSVCLEHRWSCLRSQNAQGRAP